MIEIDGFVFGAEGKTSDIIKSFPKDFLEDSLVKKSRKELYNLAFLDSLTKTYNRNMFEEVSKILNEMELFITVVDIDGLKKINDTYGHNTGDEVIKDIAYKLMQFSELVFRFSGDEFLLIDNRQLILDIPKISYGCVLKKKNVSLSEAIKSADSLMYTYKKQKN